jgi:hypothetical protein
VLSRGRIELRKEEPHAQEGEHIFEGIENDEGQSGTMCSANNGT